MKAEFLWIGQGKGWRRCGFPHFDAGFGISVAHDTMEHSESDVDGNLLEELHAIGALLFIRGGDLHNKKLTFLADLIGDYDVSSLSLPEVLYGDTWTRKVIYNSFPRDYLHTEAVYKLVMHGQTLTQKRFNGNPRYKVDAAFKRLCRLVDEGIDASLGIGDKLHVEVDPTTLDIDIKVVGDSTVLDTV